MEDCGQFNRLDCRADTFSDRFGHRHGVTPHQSLVSRLSPTVFQPAIAYAARYVRCLCGTSPYFRRIISGQHQRFEITTGLI